MKAVGDPNYRKALAFAILIKDRNATSVFKDWSYRDVARCAGIAPTTAKRYISFLRDKKLVKVVRQGGHEYLVFKKLRKPKIRNKYNIKYHTPRRSDVSLAKIDRTDVNTIAKSLMALDIENTLKRKEYVKRVIKTNTDPAPRTPKREKDKAKRLCRDCGWAKYREFGYSYRGIAKRLHCSPNTIKKVLALGQRLTLFEIDVQEPILLCRVGKERVLEALKYFRYNYPTAFATSTSIYYRPASVLRLPDLCRDSR